MPPAPLLPRHVPRSDRDPEVSARMHPITGAFADPVHTADFEASMFRLAYPVHVAAMALSGMLCAWILIIETSVELRVNLSSFSSFSLPSVSAPASSPTAWTTGPAHSGSVPTYGRH